MVCIVRMSGGNTLSDLKGKPGREHKSLCSLQWKLSRHPVTQGLGTKGGRLHVNGVSQKKSNTE